MWNRKFRSGREERTRVGDGRPEANVDTRPEIVLGDIMPAECENPASMEGKGSLVNNKEKDYSEKQLGKTKRPSQGHCQERGHSGS